MPELPEVESIISALSKKVIGQIIRSVNIFWPKTVATPSVKKFVNILKNCRVESITRRGKYLILRMQNKKTWFLIIHLRMSGKLFVCDSSVLRSKHERVVIHFHNGTDLRFNDTRKFGRMWLVTNEFHVLAKLGPEIHNNDLMENVFHSLLLKYKRNIKSLLLDQSVVAGIGNIYAD